VTPTANRYRDLVSAGKIDRVDHVSNPGAPNDEGWFLIDRSVKNLTSIIVAVIARAEKFSTQGRPELLDYRFVKKRARSRLVLDCHDVFFSSRFPLQVGFAHPI
jgi:hypothetical protein